jgi:hypothetical protein
VVVCLARGTRGCTHHGRGRLDVFQRRRVVLGLNLEREQTQYSSIPRARPLSDPGAANGAADRDGPCTR